MDDAGGKATRQYTRDINERLVLRTIYDLGEVSRADLARLTSLTRTTVSDVMQSLIERELVEEIGQSSAANVGRAPVLVRINDQGRVVLALNVSRQTVEGALVGLRGNVISRIVQPRGDCEGPALVDLIGEVADLLMLTNQRPLLGIGVATPGMIDPTDGHVIRSVDLNWTNLPLGRVLQDRYDLPVLVTNDSHALALSEYLFGEWRGTANMIVLYLAEGIGAGMILNGRLFTGDGFGVGEIGHLSLVDHGIVCRCGNRGCLEKVAALPAVLQRTAELAERMPASRLAQRGHAFAPALEDLVAALQAGDPAAQLVAAELSRHLAPVLAAMTSMLSIHRVAISGPLGALGDALLPFLQQALAERMLPDVLRRTQLRVQAPELDGVILGAAAPVLMRMLGLSPLPRNRQSAEAVGAADGAYQSQVPQHSTIL
jgi:N-acetylglucosamine repressor